jgi:hypothetical protein
MSNRHIFIVNRDAVKRILDERHWCQKGAALQLGISRTYLNLLVNQRRRLTPTMRRKFLNSAVFEGCDPDTLWDRVDRDDAG